MAKWDLGHSYNLTQYFNDLVRANKIIGTNNCYEHGYFVAHDVWDTHIYRIQVGINSEYEVEPRTKIIETYDISNSDIAEYCIEKYNMSSYCFRNSDEREYIDLLINRLGIEDLLKAIVELDYENGFDNEDVTEFRYDTPISELIESIDDGYGISEIELSL